jgi:DNA-binding NarL/FixJ family response regulator
MTTIRIMIVDDHAMVRMGLRGVLSGEPGLEVVAEARDGQEALDRFPVARPDVVLMDITLPGMSGIETTRRLVATHPGARILTVSMHDTAEDVHRALAAGATGYVPKSAEAVLLMAAVRTVANGQRFLPPDLARRLADRDAKIGLSPREVEVLALVAQGQANKQIALALGLSEATVKTHLAHILEKLGAPDRTRAVTIAMEMGLLRQ